MAPDQDPQAQQWRVTTLQRVVLLLPSAVLLVGAVGLWASGAPIGTALFIGALLLWTAWAWRRAVVPFIELRTDELVVQNAVRRQTLKYADVHAVDAGHYGVDIQLRGRALKVVACAVQKSKYAKMRGRRTRADEVVDSIRGRLGSA